MFVNVAAMLCLFRDIEMCYLIPFEKSCVLYYIFSHTMTVEYCRYGMYICIYRMENKLSDSLMLMGQKYMPTLSSIDVFNFKKTKIPTKKNRPRRIRSKKTGEVVIYLSYSHHSLL